MKYKEFHNIGVAISVSWHELEHKTRERLIYGEIMRFLFCDYADDDLEYAIFTDNDNNYYCVALLRGGRKMFDRVIVTTVTHEIVHNDTMYDIIKIETGENKILFSDGVYSWIYNTGEVVTVVLTQRGIDKNAKNNK